MTTIITHPSLPIALDIEIDDAELATATSWDTIPFTAKLQRARPGYESALLADNANNWAMQEMEVVLRRAWEEAVRKLTSSDDRQQKDQRP